MSQESTPEYGRLRNFWQAKSGTDGSSPTKAPLRASTGSEVVEDLKPSSQLDIQSTPPSNANNHSEDDNDMSDLAPSALEFDQDIVGVHLAEFLQVAQKLGGEIAEHAVLVKHAFNVQKNFLGIATRFAKPNDAEIQKLLTATSEAITSIQKFRESRRSSPFFNHLSGVSESVPALAWVAISPTPGPHIKEMNDAGQFYTNRVLKDFKDKPGHSDWVRTWVGTLTALQMYVKKNHTTGLVWGKVPYAGATVPPPPVSVGGPPPPPPPPAFDLDFDNLNVSDERAALFAELNKGENVTKSLKKVTADMQTHKNPNLRTAAPVPDRKLENGGSGTQAVKHPTVKPPKFSLEGKKWVIEHQVGQKDLKIEKTELNQIVYLFGCKDSTIQVKGKLNAIVIDSCVKVAVVFDSLLASVEFVNSRDCQMQVIGTVPTITIDKVDGLQMFLSKDSLQVEIVSAKSSALNVMVPQQDGDYTELPVPEQFKTTIRGKGLVTVATESG